LQELAKSSKKQQPTNMKENIEIAKQGCSVAKIARQAAEAKIEQAVISSTNAQDLIAEKQAQQQHKTIAQPA
jgi:hypothetical protein